MQLDYEARIEHYFIDPEYKLLIKKIGLEKARTVKKRANQLKSSCNFNVFVNTKLGLPHRLKGDLSDCFAIGISGNYRLIVKPCVQDCGDVEQLKGCVAAVVKGVVDYHGSKENWLIP